MDGRIHPARIEELVEKAQRDVDSSIKEAGENAVYESGIVGLHPEIVKTLGRLKYRTSYGQNALKHSLEVCHLAGLLASEIGANVKVAKRGALLHDIGIVHVDAPAIACFGAEPYIRHGVLGADILRNEGLERHALVCERHTVTGLTLQQIAKQGLPIPHRDMQPVSIEEQIICFADKFFSKTKLDREKTVEQARRSLEKFGEEGLVKFDTWCARFL